VPATAHGTAGAGALANKSALQRSRTRTISRASWVSPMTSHALISALALLGARSMNALTVTKDVSAERQSLLQVSVGKGRIAAHRQAKRKHVHSTQADLYLEPGKRIAVQQASQSEQYLYSVHIRNVCVAMVVHAAVTTVAADLTSATFMYDNQAQPFRQMKDARK
jgi:hypothetical protein